MPAPERVPAPADRRERVPYEWAVLRVVPRVERGEQVNVGVLLYCQPRDFLAAATAMDEARVLALDPDADLDAIRRHLTAIEQVCAGAPGTGANGARSRGDRFRWLTSPRSTVVQTSPIHTGLADDPERELERLVDCMVRPPAPLRLMAARDSSVRHDRSPPT